MDTAQFDIALAASLGDPVESAGMDGWRYSAAMRQQCAIRACHEYTRYKKLLRRYGTGNMFSNTPVGSTSFFMVGGAFVQGDLIILDPELPNYEQLTVESYAPYTVEPQPAGAMVGTTFLQTTAIALVTTTTATVNAHSDGAFVTKNCPGLAFVQGQGTYYLPYDWIQPENSTLDLATGVKLSPRRTTGFYDGSYYMANRLYPDLYGEASNFSGGGAFGYSIAGDPYDNPNAIEGNPAAWGDYGWVFYLSSQPKVVFLPTPGGPGNLDFNYYGSHTITSIANSDYEPVLQYARHVAIEGRILSFSEEQPDRKIGEATYSTSKTVANLQLASDKALKEFDVKIRKRPYVIMG